MILRSTFIGAALIAAPLTFAAPAMADPGGMNFDCAPCVGGSDRPIWNQVFDPNANGVSIWENAFQDSNGQGPWERAFDPNNDGIGAWEKAFPPAEE
ncbi:hypothetical protein [Mycolicibacterium sp.]|uniref:hypothetical protein n=1 Tax=Mycolicibacterium sp. TaxID=2320850 RepID=UPI0037C5D329